MMARVAFCAPSTPPADGSIEKAPLHQDAAGCTPLEPSPRRRSSNRLRGFLGAFRARGGTHHLKHVIISRDANNHRIDAGCECRECFPVPGSQVQTRAFWAFSLVRFQTGAQKTGALKVARHVHCPHGTEADKAHSHFDTSPRPDRPFRRNYRVSPVRGLLRDALAGYFGELLGG